MGREIRRVPANWEHPRQECPHSPWSGGCDEAKAHGGQCYHPMFDEDFDTALTEWVAGYELWKKGEHPEQKDGYMQDEPYWEYDGAPPNPYYYHPRWDNAEWYQVYETVSEGTPVTPPFSTKEELVDYLVQNGDFWDQHRGDGGWSRDVAQNFVEREWAMSAVFIVRPDGTGEAKAPRTGA